MDAIIKGPEGEVRTTLPLALHPRPDGYDLKGGDMRTIDLSALADGEMLTVHMAEEGGFEEDAAFAVTRRDGILRLIRAGRESDLVHRPGWGPHLAFAPWSLKVMDGDRVLESWPASSRAEADATASERAAEHGRERGRWHPAVTCEIAATPRIPMAELQPQEGPAPR